MSEKQDRSGATKGKGAGDQRQATQSKDEQLEELRARELRVDQQKGEPDENAPIGWTEESEGGLPATPDDREAAGTATAGQETGLPDDAVQKTASSPDLSADSTAASVDETASVPPAGGEITGGAIPFENEGPQAPRPGGGLGSVPHAERPATTDFTGSGQTAQPSTGPATTQPAGGAAGTGQKRGGQPCRSRLKCGSFPSTWVARGCAGSFPLQWHRVRCSR